MITTELIDSTLLRIAVALEKIAAGTVWQYQSTEVGSFRWCQCAREQRLTSDKGWVDTFPHPGCPRCAPERK